MTAKKPSRGGASSSEDTEVLARVPLQSVLLADSFAQKFRPITLERPKVLLPLVGVPMIEYALAWLESAGVEEVFVFCCAHSKQVKDYLKTSQWVKQPSFKVTTIESQEAVSAGDALRFIYDQNVIQGDFILMSGDTISNMNITQALKEHKERRKKDPLAVMTMIIRHAKSSQVTHQTRLGNDEVLMTIDPDTKELLYYEDKEHHSKKLVSLDRVLLADIPALSVHTDKEDCYIDICSPEVLSLFADNFDYQHLRRHFVKGLLGDDIMGYRIFTHEIHSSYAARVENFRSYDTISKDIIQRWTYPFVPDVQNFSVCSAIKLDRLGIYKGPEVNQSHSAQVGAFSLIGNGTKIGDFSVISNSVIGRGCTIGSNVSIKGCYIWDNVTIEDDCRLSYVLVCDGVRLRAGAVLEPGAILSFKVEVGRKFVVPAYSKVSLLPQPCKQDSDEELEYADTTSGVVDSPSISSIMTTNNAEILNDSADDKPVAASVVGISGVGYIWSVCDGGNEEDWRYSIAPIPAEKLMELSLSVHAEHDVVDGNLTNTPVSGELQPNSENSNDVEDYQDYADFEKEVEATFLRTLAGVKQDDVLIEIQSLRLSYNMEQADCAGALFHAIMRSVLMVPYSSNNELLSSTIKELKRWKDLLKTYLTTQDEEIEVILKFEEICMESATAFAPLFSRILNFLYDEDIVTEDAILSWEREKEGADESDKIFVKQSEAFIRWLKEAPEEEEEEDE